MLFILIGIVCICIISDSLKKDIDKYEKIPIHTKSGKKINPIAISTTIVSCAVVLGLFALIIWYFIR